MTRSIFPKLQRCWLFRCRISRRATTRPSRTCSVSRRINTNLLLCLMHPCPSTRSRNILVPLGWGRVESLLARSFRINPRAGPRGVLRAHPTWDLHCVNPIALPGSHFGPALPRPTVGLPITTVIIIIKIKTRGRRKVSNGETRLVREILMMVV